MPTTPVTLPEGRSDCLSADGIRHKLLIKTPVNASLNGFAVTGIVPSSLRVAGDPARLLLCTAVCVDKLLLRQTVASRLGDSTASDIRHHSVQHGLQA